MSRVVAMYVVAVVLAVLAAPGPVHSQAFRIEAILAGACSTGASCGESRDRIAKAPSGDLSITLAITWVNEWSVFQIYSYIKSLDVGSVDLLLIDEHLTRLIHLPGQSSGCPFIIFPALFRFKKRQPLPEIDDDCCDDFVNDLDGEQPTDNVNNCLQWPDSATELGAVIKHLAWKEVIMVYDQLNEQEATAVTDNIKNCQLFMHLIDSNIYPTPKLMNPTSSLTSVWTPPQNDELESRHSLELAAEDKIRDFIRGLYANVAIEKNIQVVLVCTLENVKRILTLANRFDKENNKSSALHFRSRWLLSLPMERATDDGVTTFLESLDNLDNVAVIDSRHTRYKGDINSDANMEVLLTELMTLVADGKEKINLTASVSQILQSRNDHCLDTQVNTLYYGGRNGRYMNTVAMVTETTEVMLLGKNGIFPNIQFALNKRNLTVAVVQWAPFVIKTGNRYDGISIELLRQLEMVLNFTAHITEPNDGKWGTRLDNGSYSGLVGQLQRREVEMVVAPLAMLPERELVLDFAFPFFTDYTTVMLKMPDSNRLKWLTLIQPFKWEVYLAISVSLLSVALLITILERQNPYYKTRSERSAFHNILDSLWYMYGSLLTQGGEELPTSTTGLTLVSFWLMFSVVVSSTYSGNLIAFLTVTIDSPPFNSLQDMLDQNVYKWGTLGKVTDNFQEGFELQEQFLKLSTDPKKHAVWERIKIFNQSDPSVLSPHREEHRNKVMSENYAFIGDKSTIDNMANGLCHVWAMRDNFFPKSHAVGLVNNSAYRIMVTNEVIKVGDLGLQHIWRSRWSTRISPCPGNLVTDATAISLLDVQSAFYMICIGIVISALALAAERLRVYAVSRRGGRHYSFSMSSSNSHNEVPLNKYIKTTETDRINMNDLDSNEAVTSNHEAVVGKDLEVDVNRHMYAPDVEPGCELDTETDSINQLGSSFYAGSMDSGYDDYHQRQKGSMFKDTVPFYLARIHLPTFIGRSRSTSL